MKSLIITSVLFFSITAFSQTTKKELTPEEKKIRVQRYTEYLKKQNRKRDSIYKIGQFSENSYPTNNDSDIMNRILRKESARNVKKDSATKSLNEGK